jgi:hypothetical protein
MRQCGEAMTLLILLGLCFLGLLAAIVVAAHYRSAAIAASSVTTIMSAGVKDDIAALEQTVGDLVTSGSLPAILARLNSVATLVKALVDDKRAPDPAASAPTDADPPVAAAPADAAAPAAESGGTEIVQGALALLDSQIEVLQARKHKLEDAAKALQEALK